MTLKYTILIQAAPFIEQGSYTAYRFCKALLAKEQRIEKIFFYGQGVQNANADIISPQDEMNGAKLWEEFAQEHGIELMICVTAALRRGLSENNLIKGFKISGLGQLIQAIANSDRFIAFH